MRKVLSEMSLSLDGNVAGSDVSPEAPTGRSAAESQPRDFSDYARDATATGIWNPRATRTA